MVARKVAIRNEDRPEYSAWKGMRQRCDNPRYKQFKDYGGRGISYDPSWAHFHTFLADMGPRPSPQHSLDRIDNAEGYSHQHSEI